MGNTIEMTVKLDKTPDKLAKDLGVNKQFNHFMALTAWRLMIPYTPMETGVLSNTVDIWSDDESGYIKYLSPYANYMYRGILYVDPITGKGAFYNESFGFWSRKNVKKVPTTRELNFDKSKNPLATSYWDKAMLSAKGDEYTRTLNNARRWFCR